MNFFKNIKNFHNKFSFNIFTICGYIIFLGFCVNFIQSKLLDSYALLWQLSLFNVIYLITLFISVIIYIFEKIFCFEIRNDFFIKNHIICILRYIGVSISTIYFFIAIIFLKTIW